VRDIITIILTIIGLWFAGQGLSTWKKQIKGSKEIETAYDLHVAIIKFREAIKFVRNPFIPVSEIQRAISQIKKESFRDLTDNITGDDSAYAYEVRYLKVLEAKIELDSCLLIAEALWGRKIFDMVKPLKDKSKQLSFALKQNFRPNEVRVMDVQNIDNIIYDKSEENKQDNFSKEISDQVELIAKYLREKIEDCN